MIGIFNNSIFGQSMSNMEVFQAKYFKYMRKIRLMLRVNTDKVRSRIAFGFLVLFCSR
jgi:hypothetical protein